jgi:hypothetical protein
VKRLALLVLLAACGPKHASPPPSDDDTLPDPVGGGGPGFGGDPANAEPEPKPPENELQTRQYAACDAVVPRLTECAVEDARAKMSADELKKLDLEHTAPIHTREYTKKCKNGYMSSRQVRVYEVCNHETKTCDDLIPCLDNAKPQK